MTARTRIAFGIDFDNTVACYDRAFPEFAVERGLLAPGAASTKKEVRDELRRQGREDAWTELQGYVYGPGMTRAAVFPGVQAFFDACRAAGVPVSIVSHRTRHPYLGACYDLHAAALGWLDTRGLEAVPAYFELTKEAKLARIARVGCTHFVDDLPEFLAEPGFPRDVEKILFDPLKQHRGTPGVRRVGSWDEIALLALEEAGR